MNLETLIQTLAQTHQALQQQANRSINIALVARNWLFGCYTVEFEQTGEDRAQQGKFHQTYFAIHQTASGELSNRLPLSQLNEHFA